MWIHVLPGRARARVPALLGNPGRAARLVCDLQRCPGVRSATASPITATVLIHYDPAVVGPVQLAGWIAPCPAAGEAAASVEEVVPAAVVPGAPVISLGLTSAEVARRRSDAGPNLVPEPPRKSFLQRLLGQYRDAMQLTLIGGAGLSFLAGHRGDALTMFGVLLLNGLIGAGQSGRPSRAWGALREMGDRPARVVRDGAEQVVSAADLVPGDLLLVEAGDRVPADAAVAAGVALAADESLLTGESVAVEKSDPGALLAAGSLVVRGRGAAVVTTTGGDSTLGRIAGLLEQADRPSPLQVEMDGMGRRIARSGLWLAVGVAGLSLLRGGGLATGLLTGISLAISAVPEGLPSFVTLALASGSRRMEAKGATFQRLSAVETMGAVTTLCCDKTGTLTQGEMAVRELLLPDGHWTVSGQGFCPEGEFRRAGDGRTTEPLAIPGLRRLLKVAALCTNARLGLDDKGALQATGDPTEVALLVAALKAGLRAQGGEGLRLLELPFDSDRRCMSVVCGDGSGQALVCTKGAPETLLPLCSHVFARGKAQRLDSRQRRRFEREAATMAARGLRVLAVAYRASSPACPPERLEQDLTLLGLAALADPPRPEAAAAVQRCRQAGVRVLMITGDHPATAEAIGRQVGLEGNLLTGAQLAVMTDQELTEAAPALALVARATPDQKLRVVRALRHAGQVVAMAGDGVNDAPAMREADVGIAMGDRGTEVARATAGLVLEDDSLLTMVASVEQGRGTRENVGRMARYLLRSNSAELTLMASATVVGLPLPLLPMQLLYMNLVGDGLPAAALGAEPPEPRLMERPPRPGNALLGPPFRRQVAAGGLRTGLAVAGLYAWTLATGHPLPQARTIAMAALAGSQVRHLMACRSRQGSPAVGRAGAAAACLTLAALYFPPLRSMLKLAPLGLGELALAAGTALVAR